MPLAQHQAVYLGSKSFGLTVLKALCSAEVPVRWHVICPDDQDDPRCALDGFQTFVAEARLELTVTPSVMMANDLLRKLSPDVLMACGWYGILPTDIVESVPQGCFGLHNSLLPKYRGWAPLVWSIINGDEYIGASVFKFTSEMDDGDLLHQVRVNLACDDTIADALRKIETEVERDLPAVWSDYLAGKIKLTVQDHDQASYCGRRVEADGRIDWTQSARDIHNFIRAQAPPYPGAFTYDNADTRITIFASAIDSRVYLGTPGQVLEVSGDGVVVACGQSSAIKVSSLLVAGEVVPAPTVLKSTLQRLA